MSTELNVAKFPEKIHRDKMLAALESLGIDSTSIYEARISPQEIELHVEVKNEAGARPIIPSINAYPRAVVTIPITDSQEHTE